MRPDRDLKKVVDAALAMGCPTDILAYSTPEGEHIRDLLRGRHGAPNVGVRVTEEALEGVNAILVPWESR